MPHPRNCEGGSWVCLPSHQRSARSSCHPKEWSPFEPSVYHRRTVPARPDYGIPLSREHFASAPAASRPTQPLCPQANPVHAHRRDLLHGRRRPLRPGRPDRPAPATRAVFAVLLLTPLLWSLPTALMVSELATASPKKAASTFGSPRPGPFWGFRKPGSRSPAASSTWRCIPHFSSDIYSVSRRNSPPGYRGWLIELLR